ncbi:MAG: hypothetical protein CMQ15_01310 [Gammaproteobacteria bacterium]|nr:hypothetical protein [Gammaproteobacteria bacterium]
MKFYLQVPAKHLQAVSSVMSPTKNLIVNKFMKIFGCIKTQAVTGHFQQSFSQNKYFSTTSRIHLGWFLS